MKILEWATSEEQQLNKTVLNSSPSNEEIKSFDEVCTKIMKGLKNPKRISKEHLHTEDTSNSLYSTSMVRKTTLIQHLGEYQGPDFAGFLKKIASAFEKAHFNVRKGYGINDMKGYEILDKEGEVIGEIDFLEAGSVPKVGNLVIFKHKKI